MTSLSSPSVTPPRRMHMWVSILLFFSSLAETYFLQQTLWFLSPNIFPHTQLPTYIPPSNCRAQSPVTHVLTTHTQLAGSPHWVTLGLTPTTYPPADNSFKTVLLLPIFTIWLSIRTRKSIQRKRESKRKYFPLSFEPIRTHTTRTSGTLGIFNLTK